MDVKIEPGWKSKLSPEFQKEYFIRLADFIKNEYRIATIYPPGSLIFNAFDICPFEEVKAVIIGQDPYHGPGQAHGLCFSVREGVEFPPSLINIFKEIESDLGIQEPSSGNLTRWARQGVLLLNATLTVRAHLWGAYAQKKGESIDRTRHLVLESVHPSPLSASKGFFGNKHFSRCNDYLIRNGIEPIDWR
jgi:uracil-DNA glycosylase